MTQEFFQPGKNRLLTAVPRRQYDRLRPHLESVSLHFEEVLYEPDKPIRHVYFPTSGMISLLLVLNDGSIAEVGRIGNEGMVCLPVFLGMGTSHTRAFVQIPGEALRGKQRSSARRPAWVARSPAYCFATRKPCCTTRSD
jgi:CRP-like cAMP-binding protein